MKKIDITGWKQVFSFTFIQTVKTKSYIVTMIILCLIAAIGIPVAGYFNNPDKKVEAEDSSGNAGAAVQFDNLKTVYVNYDADDEDVNERFKEWSNTYSCNLEYLKDADVEATRKTLNDHNDTCIILIENNAGVYAVKCITGWDVADASEEQQELSGNIAEELKDIQMSRVIADSEMPDAMKDVKAYVSGNEAPGHDESFMQRYVIWLSSITILVFIITSSGSGIANSIVVEKSSRMVEYLMLTIKPMAIVFGKVLAGLLSVLVQVAAVITAGVLSALASINLFDLDVMGMINVYLTGDGEGIFLSSGISIFGIIIVVAIILTGMLFYAVVASISGASVSKLEEMREGLLLFTIAAIVGAYMSLALSMSNMVSETGQLTGVFAMVCCLLPLSSVFTVPINIIMGTVPLYIGLIAVAINIVSIILLLIITSRIYEYMLFYNGVTLKIKDIIYICRYGRVKEGK